MKDHEDYEIQLTEIHHTAKKDAPSGTAITLQNKCLKIFPAKQNGPTI